jgi:GntR family transcriptional regulator
MIFHVDPHSGVPIFRQLIDQVRLAVATGALRPGDELPSIRTLAVPLGINPMTISKAYGILEREGVLERRPGRPLVIGEIETERMMSTKHDQLKKSLRPSVTMASQLGIAAPEALRIFREMLARGPGPRTQDQEDEKP